MENGSEAARTHALLLASPGLGHVIPVLELGNRLSSVLGFRVTIFVVPSGTSAAESAAIRAAAARGACKVTELPRIDVGHVVEPNAAVVTKLAVMMREIKPAVRTAVLAMKFKPDVLIVDLFGTELLDIAEVIGVRKYVYIASHVWFLALMVYVPILDETVEGEYVEQKEPLKIPGCRPVRPNEVVDPMLDRTNQQYREFVRTGMEVPKSDGVLVNTWEVLQEETMAAMRQDGELGHVVRVPIYAVGPIVRPRGPEKSNERVFEWLDRQPERSVVYVCLGSGGTLSFQQTTELARGLELSGQRFIWVVRRPTVRTGDGSFLAVGSGDDDVGSFLPEGFLGRTSQLGLVIPQWSPQVEILSHRSIGGFLSHCGWNSTLESITKGVPMIAWPLYAEQRMNATLLTEEIGVAVRPKTLPTEGVIGGEEICALVKKIMSEDEGHVIRAKAEKVKLTAERAWAEGGTSCDALSEWAKRCLAP